MQQTLVFHWSDPLLERMERMVYFLMALLFLSIPIVLFYIFSKTQLSSADWLAIWQKLSQKPLDFVKLVAFLVLCPLLVCAPIWMQKTHKKRARLYLDDEAARYVSGIPGVGRWIDWTWDLDAIRSKKFALQGVSLPFQGQPLRMCQLSWGLIITKKMRPYVWRLPGQNVPPTAKPNSFFGLVRWNSPGNAALLQQQFDALPFVAALKERGISLPPVTAKTQHYPGTDLMARPRMKIAVWSLFGTMAGAFALFHAMLRQHYFSAPDSRIWIGLGLLAGAGMLAWLWSDQEDPADSTAKGRLEARVSQVIVASLFGVSAGLCMPSVPLVLSEIAKPQQEAAFTVQHAPLLLRAKAGSGIPDCVPTQALDYWASLTAGETVVLPIRQGFAGWWWQFDSSALSDKLEAFYSRQDRPKVKAKP